MKSSGWLSDLTLAQWALGSSRCRTMPGLIKAFQHYNVGDLDFLVFQPMSSTSEIFFPQERVLIAIVAMLVYRNWVFSAPQLMFKLIFWNFWSGLNGRRLQVSCLTLLHWLIILPVCRFFFWAGCIQWVFIRFLKNKCPDYTFASEFIGGSTD